MGKDPLSGALSRSLQDEDTAVEQRFARVDSILGGQGKQRAGLLATPAPPSKERAVRATFTLAEADSELLPALQQRCLEGRHSAARSEIIRAGLRALAQMQAKEFLALVKGVEKLKPGPGKRVQL